MLAGEVRRSSAARAIAAELVAPPASAGAARHSESAPRRAVRLRAPGSGARSSKDWARSLPTACDRAGLTLATARGAPVTVPASGTIRFSGPFRSYDAVVIIDHGGGWMSLLLNVASPLQAGREGPGRSSRLAVHLVE